MKTRIESLGVHLPDREVSTAELIASMENQPMFDLEKLTGVKFRRWRDEDDDSFTLAWAAAHNCLQRSGYQADQLDAIIVRSPG